MMRLTPGTGDFGGGPGRPCAAAWPVAGGLVGGQRDHDLAAGGDGGGSGLRGFAGGAEGGFHAGRHADGEGDGRGRDDDFGEAGIAGKRIAAGDFNAGESGFDGSGEIGIGHGGYSVCGETPPPLSPPHKGEGDPLNQSSLHQNRVCGSIVSLPLVGRGQGWGIRESEA